LPARRRLRWRRPPSPAVMPPKKASGKRAVVKKRAPKSEVVASPDIDFVQGLGADCDKEDVRRLLELFGSSRDKKDTPLLVGAGEAIGRVCSEAHGLKLFKDAEGVIAVAQLAAEPVQALRPAVEGLCKGAAEWLDAVDPVDYHELNNVLYFTLWLGGVDEDVAVSAVGAMERFTLHLPQHSVGMLQAGVLNLLHGLIGEHRNPEFVEQVFSFLYLLCDLPAEVVEAPLNEELEIIGTVVEMLQEAPLNMRLQMTGLRLLAMWCTRFRGHGDIPDTIREYGAGALFEDAVRVLDRSGLTHYAAWVSGMAGRCFGGVPEDSAG